MMKVSELLKQLAHESFTGNAESTIDAVVPLSNVMEHSNKLSWCSIDNIALLNGIEGNTIIVPVEFRPQSVTCNYIFSNNPRRTFQKAISILYPTNTDAGIAQSAKIHSTVKIGEGTFVGENVVIEKNCIIGTNCRINHNTVIFSNSVIGNNVIIGSNNTIGNVGFGYEKNVAGEYEFIQHIGNVRIEDHVEIGNNTCIDRAVLASTIIGRNSKIDNLVHIAHGVIIGSNSMVIANSMIAGSVEIGNNVWIAPSVSILNKVKVNDSALIGLGATVLKTVEKNDIVVGNPAKSIKKRP